MADMGHIKSLRLERGWSQEHLAELSGLSVRTIQRLERGEPAALETRRALAAAFGIPAADLMPTRADTSAGGTAPAIRRRKFFHHLTIFVTVMMGLVLLNLIKSPDRLWVVYPFFGWGLAVGLHAWKILREPVLGQTPT